MKHILAKDLISTPSDTMRSHPLGCMLIHRHICKRAAHASKAEVWWTQFYIYFFKNTKYMRNSENVQEEWNKEKGRGSTSAPIRL